MRKSLVRCVGSDRSVGPVALGAAMLPRGGRRARCGMSALRHGGGVVAGANIVRGRISTVAVSREQS